MQIRSLRLVLKRRIGAYILWLIANLGGILILYLASFSIWLIHKHFGHYLPGKEVFLATGTISLAISGVSYLIKGQGAPDIKLSPIISITWLIPMIFVYGILINLGVQDPIAPNWVVWIITILLFLLSIAWSSVVWLHEEGIILDKLVGPEQPQITPGLDKVADELPKI